MANIDNLNFKVILDDGEFNEKLKKLERDAQKFNTSMSNLLNVKKAGMKISQEELRNNRRVLQAKVDEVKAQEKINREKKKTEALQRKLNAQVDKAANGTRKMSVSSNDFANTFMQLAAFGGISSLVHSIVRITGEFELQKKTLAAMLHDMDAAEHIISKVMDLSLASPFSFGELTGYVKQLSAFAVPEAELFDTTKMIADLSAGLGVAADRLILAFGQVKAAAFLRGQEVRQFTEAGIPLLQELAKEFEKLEGNAISVGEVFDRISTRQVSFEMVSDVLKDLTSEGGKFFNMQQVQADTLQGRMKQMKSQWQIALNEMGKSNSSFINGAISSITGLISNYEKIGNILRTIIITYGAYKAALAAAWVIEKLMAAGKLAQSFIVTLRATKSLASGFNSLKMSLSGVLGVAGLVVGAIYALATNSGSAEEEIRDLEAEMNQMMTSALNKVTALERAFDALENLTRGTQKYRDAIEEINDMYGDYLPKLLSEQSSYEEIAEAAEHAKDAIIEKSRQDALNNRLQAIERKYETKSQSAGIFLDALWANTPNEKEAAAILKLFESNLEDGQASNEAFVRALVSYYGSAEKAFNTSIGKFALAQTNMEKFIKDFNSSIFSFSSYEMMTPMEDYANQFLNKSKEIEQAYEQVNAIFTKAEWDNSEEYAMLRAAEKVVTKKLLLLDEEVLSVQERARREVEIEATKYEALARLYEGKGHISKANDYRKEAEELLQFAKSWRGKVQDLLRGMDLTANRSFGLWPDEYTSSTDYVERLLKDYKEVSDQIDKIGFDPKSLENAENQKETIEAIAKLLEIDLVTGKSTRTSGKTELEKKIDALSALKKAYDNLKAINLSDATIISMLKDSFPDILGTYGSKFIEDLNFVERILDFGAELKKTEPDRANTILSSLGLTELDQDISKIEEAISAAKKYYEAIRKWQTSDFNIEGKGTAFDIGKIANQLSTKFNEIGLNAEKLKETLSQIDVGDAVAMESVKNSFEKEFGQGTWDTFYAEFIKEGKSAIDKFAEMEREYERKLAQEKLNDMAKKVLNEAIDNMDMSHWGDKTVGQIEDIRKRLAGLMKEDIILPDSTIQLLEELGLTTEDLQKKIKELLGEKYDDATVEKFKALAKVVGQVSSMAKSLGEDLIELGETTDNIGLVNLGNTLKQFEQLATAITECNTLMGVFEKKADGSYVGLEELVKSSDFITLIVKVATMAITSVVNGINESQKAWHEARMAAIEYAHAIEQIEYEDLMSSYDSIFGTDEYKRASEAMRKASDYMQSALDKVAGIKSKLSFGEMFMMSSDEAAYINSWLKAGDILVDARTSWQRFWGTGDDLRQKFNISEFIDADGTLMGDKLREFLNTYGEDIAKENKELLTQMLNDYDLYLEAVAESESYLQSLFGNVADSIADSFIEAFKASGEAALDYADIMDGVATEIAKSVVKSMVLENILDPEKLKRMSELLLSGEQAGAMQIFDEVMQSASNLAPYIQQFLEEMRPYFNMESDAQNLAEGIKGMTEDTANLLASYLNAIRADVSYAKTLWERMDVTTRQIASLLSGLSTPTLMEYQAQIAANTFNAAQNSYEIMMDLKSVLTSEGGSRAIRTLS